MSLGDDAGRLLDQVDVLRHPSDLDLLVFFARHPRTLLSSEHIAAFLGYGVKEIAASLELLLEARFLTRTPHPRHAARMYVLAVTPPGDGWLRALTRLASTRDGRLALISELRHRFPNGVSGLTQRPNAANVVSPPLQFPHGRTAVAEGAQKQHSASTRGSSEPRQQNEQGGRR